MVRTLQSLPRRNFSSGSIFFHCCSVRPFAPKFTQKHKLSLTTVSFYYLKRKAAQSATVSAYQWDSPQTRSRAEGLQSRQEPLERVTNYRGFLNSAQSRRNFRLFLVRFHGYQSFLVMCQGNDIWIMHPRTQICWTDTAFKHY